MSIIVTNMKMPKYCEDCHFVYDSFGYCSMADKDIENYSFRNGKNERPKWCPLKENTELENQKIGHCKDCNRWKQGKRENNEDWYSDEGFCNNWRVITGKDFYCADFEAKENKE